MPGKTVQLSAADLHDLVHRAYLEGYNDSRVGVVAFCSGMDSMRGAVDDYAESTVRKRLMRLIEEAGG